MVNSHHGDRLTVNDKKNIAREIAGQCSKDEITQIEMSNSLSVSQQRISEWVADIRARQTAGRDNLIKKLHLLGWTQAEIGEVIGKTRQRVQQIANNVDTNIICNSYKEGKSIEEIASFNDLDIQTTWNIILDGKSDEDRAKELDIDIKKYF